MIDLDFTSPRGRLDDAGRVELRVLVDPEQAPRVQDREELAAQAGLQDEEDVHLAATASCLRSALNNLPPKKGYGYKRQKRVTYQSKMSYEQPGRVSRS